MSSFLNGSVGECLVKRPHDATDKALLFLFLTLMLYVSEGVFLAIFKLLMSNIVSTQITHESILYKMYPYSTAVAKASVLSVNADLYNCIRKSGNLVCDRFDHVISSVGRTSIEVQFTLSEKSTGRVFVKHVDRLVLFDVKTKKINQLEKFTKELILRNINLTSSSINIKPTSSAPPTFTAARVVRPEQVDHNNHLAATWYVVMAVSAINEANSQNFFKQSACDFTSTGLRAIQLELVHQGEALLGDELVFCVWREIDVIKLQMTKNTTTNIAYLVIGLDNNTKSYL